jgi:hypothetical protein
METLVEQRKHQRYPVHFKSIFSADGKQIEDGWVLDLCLGGCRMTSGTLIPPGTVLELHIRPEQHAPVYIPGAVVRWARGSDFGVQFNYLPEIESATLNRLLYLLPSLGHAA